MDELRHHRKVIDMMLTMFSILRDRFSSRQLIIEILQLVGSALVILQVIVDPKILQYISIDPSVGIAVLRIAAISLFLVTLISMKAGLRQKASSYAQGSQSLARLKHKVAAIVKAEPPASVSDIKEMNHLCSVVIADAPKIPDREFPKLKLAHKKKVLLSKLIDKHPSVPLWRLNCAVLWRGLRTPINIDV